MFDYCQHDHWSQMLLVSVNMQHQFTFDILDVIFFKTYSIVRIRELRVLNIQRDLTCKNERSSTELSLHFELIWRPTWKLVEIDECKFHVKTHRKEHENKPYVRCFIIPDYSWQQICHGKYFLHTNNWWLMRVRCRSCVANLSKISLANVLNISFALVMKMHYQLNFSVYLSKIV